MLTKHVESFQIPCLDQGSIPCISTRRDICDFDVNIPFFDLRNPLLALSVLKIDSFIRNVRHFLFAKLIFLENIELNIRYFSTVVEIANDSAILL